VPCLGPLCYGRASNSGVGDARAGPGVGPRAGLRAGLGNGAISNFATYFATVSKASATSLLAFA
jgi:hypothetical protein